MRQAPYAILSANVRDTSGKTPSWLRADTLIDIGGTKIGVIGAISGKCGIRSWAKAVWIRELHAKSQ